MTRVASVDSGPGEWCVGRREAAGRRGCRVGRVIEINNLEQITAL